MLKTILISSFIVIFAHSKATMNIFFI